MIYYPVHTRLHTVTYYVTYTTLIVCQRIFTKFKWPRTPKQAGDEDEKAAKDKNLLKLKRCDVTRPMTVAEIVATVDREASLRASTPLTSSVCGGVSACRRLCLGSVCQGEGAGGRPETIQQFESKITDETL